MTQYTHATEQNFAPPVRRFSRRLPYGPSPADPQRFSFPRPRLGPQASGFFP